MLEMFKHSREVGLRDTLTKTLWRRDGSSAASIEDNIDLETLISKRYNNLNKTTYLHISPINLDSILGLDSSSS